MTLQDWINSGWLAQPLREQVADWLRKQHPGLLQA
jgi:hypothetical protein